MSKEVVNEQMVEETVKNEVAEQKATTEVANTVEAPMGFEDEESGDMIIPRIKIVQTLSPEKKNKQADEGDIINSLTLDKYNGKKFIPVFKFNNNILWKDRSEGGGILCMARDGKCATQSDGTNILCSACRKNEFDNTKTGKEALPKCTKYINFFGFFEGEAMPIILSFAKTNYAEGKKLFSLAKVTMQNMWNYGYELNAKLMVKGNNEWHIIVPTPAGPTSDADRALGMSLYKQFRDMNNLNFDVEDTATDSVTSTASTADTEF